MKGYVTAQDAYDNMDPVEINTSEMTDEELNENMARTWVENGGDVDGFIRSCGEIQGWIAAVMSEMGIK